MQADPGPGTVYLLHFTERIGNPDNPHGQAQHYYGWAAVLMDRITTHTLGNGRSAKIIRYIQAQGIGFQIAQTWAGDRTLERRLKRRKDAPRVCPVCRAARNLATNAGRCERQASRAGMPAREAAHLRREARWWAAVAGDVLAGRRSMDDLDMESLIEAAWRETRRAPRP